MARDDNPLFSREAEIFRQVVLDLGEGTLLNRLRAMRLLRPWSWFRQTTTPASSGSCSLEDHIDPIQNGIERGVRHVLDALHEKRLVDRYDLRHVGNGILRQARCARAKKNVAGGFRYPEIAREGNDNHGRDSTSVESVSLHNENRPAKPWSGAYWIRQVCPTDVALRDYHSVDSSTRRATSESDR